MARTRHVGIRALSPAGWIFAVAMGAALPRVARAEPSRYPSDAAELARIRASHPAAADLVEQGERLAQGGDDRAALDAFRRASDDEPSSNLVWRRRCEALTALGDAREAVKACRQAQQARVSPLNVRALVRAIASKPEPLAANEVAIALSWAGEERDRRPAEPWGYASVCEIADRIGDEVMLERCTSDLERVSPSHEATARARAALARAQSPAWVSWSGWLLLAGAALGTAAHAASRIGLRARRRSLAATSAGMLLIGSLAGAPREARAQETPAASAAPIPPPEQLGHVSDWGIDEADPLKSVPTETQRNQNPIQFGYWLMDLVARATAASKRGDHDAAIRYYIALAKAVPDRATAFQKLCEEHEALGQRDDAIRACGLALFVEGSTVGDYAHYVHLVLGKTGNLTPQEISGLTDVLAHLRETAKTNEAATAIADRLECEVGNRTANVAQLAECTAGMARRDPDAAETRWYQWSLALHQGRFDDASRMLADAKAHGIDFKGAAEMQDVTADAVARHHRNRFLAIGGLVLLAVAIGAFARVMIQRRRARAGAPLAPASNHA